MEITKKASKTLRLHPWIFQVCLLFFIALFASCKKNPDPNEFGTSTRNTLQDSIRWQEIIPKYEQMPVDLAKKDTCYLFEMHGSWGGLYHYCAIFPDSLGYVVCAESMIACAFRSEFCTASRMNKRLTSEEWHGMDRKVKQSGFWHTNLQKTGTCFDCEYYQLWIKQGKTSKVIRWASSDKVPDSTRILAMQILAWGGLPEYKPIGWYMEKKDSMIIKVGQITDTFFVKSRTIEARQFQNGEIPFDESTPNITVKADKWNPYPSEIFVKQTWIDGTETTRFITNYKKVTAREFPRR